MYTKTQIAHLTKLSKIVAVTLVDQHREAADLNVLAADGLLNKIPTWSDPVFMGGKKGKVTDAPGEHSFSCSDAGRAYIANM